VVLPRVGGWSVAPCGGGRMLGSASAPRAHRVRSGQLSRGGADVALWRDSWRGRAVVGGDCRGSGWRRRSRAPVCARARSRAVTVAGGGGCGALARQLARVRGVLAGRLGGSRSPGAIVSRPSGRAPWQLIEVPTTGGRPPASRKS